ncbi:MAG: STM4014 family protein [Verrucomicrobiales bacterium]|nr:STM4014 family protein [Verrucomicrobiales bacterium]
MTPAWTTVTSRSVNEGVIPDFGLFCNTESRRVEGFRSAVGRRLHRWPKLIPWRSVLEGSAWQQTMEPTPRFLRLESPGRNWTVERQLLLRGATGQDEEARCRWRRMPSDAIASLASDPGRVLPMRQWFLGLRQTLQELAAWAEQGGFASRWLSPPEDVICAFDKLACHQKLEDAGVAVPPALGVPRDFDELWELMRQSGWKRVFIKPCHGSSASGVVALEASRTDIQAFSTLDLIEAADGLRLYNRRRIRIWRGAANVRRLVDAACDERCLAQVWIPKAGLSGRPFDLRVVVIGGRARHVMLRLGRGPMTNSQLLGGKGDVEALRQRMGGEAWARVLTLCEDTMANCFPRSLYAGLDVLIEPDFRTARILEVNAFGDLLPSVLHDGRDTYEWEVEESLRGPSVHVSSIGA